MVPMKSVLRVLSTLALFLWARLRDGSQQSQLLQVLGKGAKQAVFYLSDTGLHKNTHGDGQVSSSITSASQGQC